LKAVESRHAHPGRPLTAKNVQPVTYGTAAKGGDFLVGER
jgi:hypothetical protein